jgi:glycosyltransferase involved in cell wall biosynthesis
MTGESEPWLSIITVVKDDPKGLMRTRASVANQTAAAYEHIVVDSSRRRDEVPAVIDATPSSRIPTRTVWVEPQGVYPAMNVGLEAARGHYAYFANAGDTLHSPGVLDKVHEQLRTHAPRWAFGDIIIREPGSQPVRTPKWDYTHEKMWLFSRGLFPPHQGTFMQVQDLRSIGGFDTSYLIAADYAAFLRMSQLADPLYLNLVIADFPRGGLSTVEWRESLKEFHRARCEVLQPKGPSRARELIGAGYQYLRMEAYHTSLKLRRH